MADMPSKKPRRGAGRVAFLARLEQFRTLVAAGHEQRTIFDDIGGQARLGISYSQFNRYIVRYITGGKDDGHQRKSTEQVVLPKAHPVATEVEGPQARDSTSAHRPEPKRPSFQHNPNSGNDRDDLI